jgi:hypothetical protein
MNGYCLCDLSDDLGNFISAGHALLPVFSGEPSVSPFAVIR